MAPPRRSGNRPSNDDDSSAATLTPPPHVAIDPALDTAKHSIRYTAEVTGITEFTLRIWEHRYRWPEPGRGTNGYRQYSERQILALKAVRKLMDSGLSIGDIMANEEFGLRQGKVPELRPPSRRPQRLALDFSAIALPTTREARRLREHLEEALCAQDRAEIDRLVMVAARLHPAERDLAVDRLIKLAGEAPKS